MERHKNNAEIKLHRKWMINEWNEWNVNFEMNPSLPSGRTVVRCDLISFFRSHPRKPFPPRRRFETTYSSAWGTALVQEHKLVECTWEYVTECCDRIMWQNVCDRMYATECDRMTNHPHQKKKNHHDHHQHQHHQHQKTQRHPHYLWTTITPIKKNRIKNQDQHDDGVGVGTIISLN